MKNEDRIPVSLLALRLSIFLVMLVWTFDKFLNPEHAAGVYAHFYFIPGVGATVLYLIGGLELALLLAFVAGIQKRFTYGLVFLLHSVSTLSSFKQYLNPYEGPSILFFAAWPMLAACFALYLLRDQDTKCTWGLPSLILCRERKAR